jgi:hypothetical protein
MRKRAGTSWWSALGWGRNPRPEAPDFGDMGTAFGLDATFAGDTDIGPRHSDTRPPAAALANPADRLKRRSAF